uniref:Uncharacterized protein n=1 Tax=Anguilla anguilla TaxID=7936 RepID=A0A0E9XCX9_ANGAN
MDSKLKTFHWRLMAIKHVAFWKSFIYTFHTP